MIRLFLQPVVNIGHQSDGLLCASRITDEMAYFYQQAVLLPLSQDSSLKLWPLERIYFTVAEPGKLLLIFRYFKNIAIYTWQPLPVQFWRAVNKAAAEDRFGIQGKPEGAPQTVSIQPVFEFHLHLDDHVGDMAIHYAGKPVDKHARETIGDVGISVQIETVSSSGTLTVLNFTPPV